MNRFIKFQKMFVLIVALVALTITSPNHAQADTFSFESIHSISEMEQFVKTHFPVGSDRKVLRKAFMTEGGATGKTHPTRKNIEKYIYDINLCHYYIWRWNISADYDENGKLIRAYVNGLNDPRLDTLGDKAPEGKKSIIVRGQFPRPQAVKGENSLAFVVWDLDGDIETRNDQRLISVGPSRPDPANMGQMQTYSNIDPWRSIFDFDEVKKIVPYHKSCNEADKLLKGKNWTRPELPPSKRKDL